MENNGANETCKHRQEKQDWGKNKKYTKNPIKFHPIRKYPIGSI